MKIQVLVGNYRGLTEDVQVFINDEIGAEGAKAVLEKRYGIQGYDSSESAISLHDFELEIKAELSLRIQENDMGVEGEFSYEQTISGFIKADNAAFSLQKGEAVFLCEERDHCKHKEWCPGLLLREGTFAALEVVIDRCPQLMTTKRYVKVEGV